MAYAPRTGPNLLRRHYPDGAEGLRAFELAKQQKKAITDARYYQRTKAEKTYGIVAPARTSNTAQAVLAVVGALNNLTDQHEASRRDAEATRRDAEATRRDNEVARRYAEAARKEAVRRGTGVLKQALSTVIAYSNVGEDQQLASDRDYSITTQSQIDMNATSDLDKDPHKDDPHEADQDAMDLGAFFTGNNAPILSPASEFFPDEGDNAPAASPEPTMQQGVGRLPATEATPAAVDVVQPAPAPIKTLADFVAACEDVCTVDELVGYNRAELAELLEDYASLLGPATKVPGRKQRERLKEEHNLLLQAAEEEEDPVDTLEPEPAPAPAAARSTSDPVSLVAEPLLVVEDKIKGEADHPGSFTTDDNSPILSPASEFFPDEGDNAPAASPEPKMQQGVGRLPTEATLATVDVQPVHVSAPTTNMNSLKPNPDSFMYELGSTSESRRDFQRIYKCGNISIMTSTGCKDITGMKEFEMTDKTVESTAASFFTNDIVPALCDAAIKVDPAAPNLVLWGKATEADSATIELFDRIIGSMAIGPGLQLLEKLNLPMQMHQPKRILIVSPRHSEEVLASVRVLTYGFVGGPATGERPDTKSTPYMLRLLTENLLLGHEAGKGQTIQYSHDVSPAQSKTVDDDIVHDKTAIDAAIATGNYNSLLLGSVGGDESGRGDGKAGGLRKAATNAVHAIGRRKARVVP